MQTEPTSPCAAAKRLMALSLCLPLLLSGCFTEFPPVEEWESEESTFAPLTSSDPLLGTTTTTFSESTTDPGGSTTGTSETTGSTTFVPATTTSSSTTTTTFSGGTTNLGSSTTSTSKTTGSTTTAPATTTTTTATTTTTTTTATTTTATTTTTTAPSATSGYTPLNYGTMKACWLSQFDMEKVYRGNDNQQRDRADFTARVEEIFDNLVSCHINTVFIQVRPYADSFYPSVYYPWSNYVTGSHSIAGTYDPLAIMVKAAHERGLSVHAWINPMRAMSATQITNVGSQYPIRQWYDDTTKRGNYIVNWEGRLYLNPAYPEVRKLIADGAAEIVRNYDIDGIHIDDYFYPTTKPEFDQNAYEPYLNVQTLSQFRLNQTSRMVKEIYQAVKAVDSRVLFGVSPAGNVQNNLDVYYADVSTWCLESGYVDYICPQIYWGFEYQDYDFLTVSRQWDQMINKAAGIKLIIGMTLENASKCTGSEWINNKDVIKRCMQSLDSLNQCRGVALFSYQFLFDPETGEANESTKQEVENFLPVLQNMNYG